MYTLTGFNSHLGWFNKKDALAIKKILIRNGRKVKIRRRTKKEYLQHLAFIKFINQREKHQLLNQ